MNAPPQPQRARWLRHVIVGFVLLTCFRIWTGAQPMVESARAQLPDSAAQRFRLIEEIRRSNELLADIRKILDTQTLNVRLQGADNQATAPAAPRRSKP